MPSLRSLTFALLALSASGCPDPQGRFDEFGERYDAINDNEGGAPPSEGCTPPATAPVVGEADGQYLFTLSVTLNPKLAFAIDVALTTKASGDQLLVDLTLQPICGFADAGCELRTEPVGDTFSFTDLPVNADGTFTWDFGEVTLVGDANPISGSDIVATLSLIGGLCAESPAFFCGDVVGASSVPFELDLAGSTFTFQKHDGALPSPLINCAKDPAEY
jgi:hypothetical protein